MGAAATECQVVVGRACQVEAVWVFVHLLVAVARRVPEGDLVTGPDRLTTQSGVGGGGAPEVVDGAGVSEHLIDGDRVHALFAYPLPLVGVLQERHHPEADGIPGRLVARDDEQREKEVALEVGEFGDRAVVERDPCLGERRPHVVGRLGTLAVSQVVGVHRHLDHGLLVLAPRLTWIGGELRVAAADGAVAPFEEERPVRIGHAEDVGDRHEREFGGHLGDEVGFADLADPVEDEVGPGPHHVIEAADHARGEARVHELAVAGVLRWVGHHHLEPGPAAGLDVGEGDAAGAPAPRTRLVRVEGAGAVDLGDVLVRGHHPERLGFLIGGGVEPDRVLTSQGVEPLVGHPLGEHVQVGEVDLVEYAHVGLPRSRRRAVGAGSGSQGTGRTSGSP